MAEDSWIVKYFISETSVSGYQKAEHQLYKLTVLPVDVAMVMMNLTANRPGVQSLNHTC